MNFTAVQVWLSQLFVLWPVAASFSDDIELSRD